MPFDVSPDSNEEGSLSSDRVQGVLKFYERENLSLRKQIEINIIVVADNLVKTQEREKHVEMLQKKIASLEKILKYEKIRTLYLPELETLLQECIWLRARLAMDNKNDVQESAKRLDQFSSVIESVIKEIHTFGSRKNLDLSALDILEKKITQTILPVRSRLIGRLGKKNVPDACTGAVTSVKTEGSGDMKGGRGEGNCEEPNPDSTIGTAPGVVMHCVSYASLVLPEQANATSTSISKCRTAVVERITTSTSHIEVEVDRNGVTLAQRESENDGDVENGGCQVRGKDAETERERERERPSTSYAHKANLRPCRMTSSPPLSIITSVSSVVTSSSSSNNGSESDSDRSNSLSPPVRTAFQNVTQSPPHSDVTDKSKPLTVRLTNGSLKVVCEDQSTAASDPTHTLTRASKRCVDGKSKGGRDEGDAADAVSGSVSVSGKRVKEETMIKVRKEGESEREAGAEMEVENETAYGGLQIVPSVSSTDLCADRDYRHSSSMSDYSSYLAVPDLTFDVDECVTFSDIWCAGSDSEISAEHENENKNENENEYLALTPRPSSSSSSSSSSSALHSTVSFSAPSSSSSSFKSDTFTSTSTPWLSISACGDTREIGEQHLLSAPSSSSSSSVLYNGAGSISSYRASAALPFSTLEGSTYVLSDAALQKEKEVEKGGSVEYRLGKVEASMKGVGEGVADAQSEVWQPAMLCLPCIEPSSSPSVPLPSTSTQRYLNAQLSDNSPNFSPAITAVTANSTVSGDKSFISATTSATHTLALSRSNTSSSHQSHSLSQAQSPAVCQPAPLHAPVSTSSSGNQALELSDDEDNSAPHSADYLSRGKRKKLNTIVPNPRKPRTADYMCANCSEVYEVVVSDNPWWAIYSQECPQCKHIQIPRIDINAPSNAIELDPNVAALYGEGVADSGDECGDGSAGEEEDEYDEEDATQGGSETLDPDDHRRDVHPFDGEGLLRADEASKLLVLMCVGFHASPTHANICKSTKYLMLHIRDCNGTDVHGRSCQFPWCLSCKKMLKHLTHCYSPSSCVICAPRTLPQSFQDLHKLNNSHTSSLSTTTSATTLSVSGTSLSAASS